jgi:hypothetical protein
MSKLPSERIGEIISEKYNPDFATERDRINAIIAYLDETAKEKECVGIDTCKKESRVDRKAPRWVTFIYGDFERTIYTPDCKNLCAIVVRVSVL